MAETEHREASPRPDAAIDGNVVVDADLDVDVDEELQRMQAELAKFEDEKSQVCACVFVCHLPSCGI